jgi:thiamine biosynthesis lipoprotein
MIRRAQPWLGTLVEITINDALDQRWLDRCMTDAFAAVALIHRLMSFHDSFSDISRINRAEVGESVDVAAETLTVLSCALMLNSASNGIFNIGSASRLIQWGLLPAFQNAPLDYDGTDTGLMIDTEQRVYKIRTAVVDLGGIAKGFAVDQAIAVLQQAGIQSACINAGGDLRAIGSIPFVVSIRDPATVTGVAHELPITNQAIATSAPYFSKRLDNNELVCALIDGRNGRAMTQPESVSVIAPNCMIADALTKIVIASKEAQHPLLNQFNAQAFIIKEDIS